MIVSKVAARLMHLTFNHFGTRTFTVTVGSCGIISVYSLRLFAIAASIQLATAGYGTSTGGGGELPSHSKDWLVQHQLAIHPTRSGEAYMAVNRQNQISARIEASGFMVEGPMGSPFWESRLSVEGLQRSAGDRLPWLATVACPNGTELIWQGQGMSLQYLHSEQGLRQNFLIDKKLEGAGPLQLFLRHQGDLIPVQNGKESLRFDDQAGTPRLVYEDLVVWDACGVPLTARLRLLNACEGTIMIEVDDAYATYPITIDPIATTPNRFIQGTIFNGEYGFSVSSAGDLNGDGYGDLAIGAPYAAMGEVQEGLVYIYYGGPNGIGATADLILESNVTNANFGYSTAHAGDVNGDGFSDLMVGAPNWESVAGQTDEGGVFIFYGSAAGITSSPDIILQPDLTNKYMGYDVASLGDINGDGYSDVIAGGWLASYGQSNEGAAWVFLGSATGLTNTPAHRLERNQAGAQFGSSVSGGGDINGDGYDDVIVGAYRFDLFQTDDGAMFVYYGGPGASPLGAGPVAQPLNPAPAQTINSAGISRRFGWCVAAAGDVNGDGYSDVITGDWRDFIAGEAQEGSAFVFHGSASGLASTPTTILQNNMPTSWYGRRVSSAGDVNGDGYADVLIGAPQFSDTHPLQGAAYIHLGGPAGIPTTYFNRYTVAIAGANMGDDLAVAGDVNGDGYSDMVVGIRIHIGFGAMHVYHGGTYLIQAPAALNAPGPRISNPANTGARTGWSVANAGDINGDGFSDVLVGAPEASNGQAGEGLVYVYYGGIGGIAALPDLTLEMNVAGARFGTSVRTAGDVNGDGYADVIVGAPASGPSGRAYIYMGGPTGLSASPALTLTGTPGSQFGFSVSTAGDINTDGYSDVVIGAPGSNFVQVHLGSPLGLDPGVHALLPAPLVGSAFGHSVATAGDVNGDGFSDLIIGAPDFSNGQAGEGGAFIYHGATEGLVTTVATQLERNVANARFGCSVAGAGDVNGSGYFDVVIGAENWDNGQAGEGAAFVFYGTPGGITLVAPTTLQINQVGAAFGTSVAEAGDVNGDGYADIVVGAPFFTGGQTNEGRVYVFPGRPSGTGTPADLVEPNVTGWRMGHAVAGGGDVDGDGFSDILCGAPFASVNGSEDGALYVYRGNRSISLPRPTRQYQADLVSPLATNSMDFSDPVHFGIGHFAKNHMQRKPGRLHWEVVFEGDAFSGSPITNSVSSTGFNPAWTDLGLIGVELKQLILKAPDHIRYKWRCRVEYPIQRSPDGQRFSRWFYGYASGHGDIGVLPVELVQFDGLAKEEGNLITWTTASERNSDRFLVERSTSLDGFMAVGEIPAAGNSMVPINYQMLDEHAPEGVSFYRLRIVDVDGSWTHSHTIAVMRNGQPLVLWPDPAEDILNWAHLERAQQVKVFDGAGRLVMERRTGEGMNTMSVASLKPGSYMFVLLDENGTALARARFIKA